MYRIYWDFELAREPARIPPFDIDQKTAQSEVPDNRTPFRSHSSGFDTNPGGGEV